MAFSAPSIGLRSHALAGAFLGRQPLFPTGTGFHVLSWIRGLELVFDAVFAGRRSLFFGGGGFPRNHPVVVRVAYLFSLILKGAT